MDELITNYMTEHNCDRQTAIAAIEKKLGPGVFQRTWDTIKAAASAEVDAMGKGIVDGTTSAGVYFGIGLGLVGAAYLGQKAGVLPGLSAPASGKVAG
jgi:formate hydrogenlyase subunit 4